MLPDMSRLTNLRHVYCVGLTQLRDISALETAPGLEVLENFGADSLEPSQYARLLSNGRLKRIDATFSSFKKNDAFNRLKAGSGIDDTAVPGYDHAGGDW
jgi:hypothetical protein